MDIKQNIEDTLNQIKPFDKLEAMHIEQMREWLKTTNDLTRQSKNPEKPYNHVALFDVLYKRENGMIKICLFEHKSSGLLLSPGGHLDDNETLFDCCKREAYEELSLTNAVARFYEEPLMHSQLDTGKSGLHYEFWFPVALTRNVRFEDSADYNAEFTSYYWYSIAEASVLSRVHPHLMRFLGKFEANENLY